MGPGARRAPRQFRTPIHMLRFIAQATLVAASFAEEALLEVGRREISSVAQLEQRCDAAVAEEEQPGLSPDVSLLQTEWTVVTAEGRTSAAAGAATTAAKSSGQDAGRKAVLVAEDATYEVRTPGAPKQPSIPEAPAAARREASAAALATAPSSTVVPNSSTVVLVAEDGAQARAHHRSKNGDKMYVIVASNWGIAVGLILVLFMVFLIMPILCLWLFGKSADSVHGGSPRQRRYPPSARGSAQSLLEARPSLPHSQKQFPAPGQLRGSGPSRSTSPRATLGPAPSHLPPTSGLSAAPQAASSGPPPVCPSLILPNTEARFMINMESLRSPTGSIDIHGTSGRKLLHADFSQFADGRRSIALCSVGCEDDPRCIITAPAASALTMTPLEILARGRRPYGTLEPGGPGWRGGVVIVGGKPVMIVEAPPSSTGEFPASLRMTASTMDGRMLAAADPTSESYGHGEQPWKLQVKVTPGSDAVLISSCMLAIHLLWPSPLAQERASRGLGPSPRGSELLEPTPHSGGIG